MNTTHELQHETISITVHAEVVPGTDKTPIAAALVTAAERANGVLAAWDADDR